MKRSSAIALVVVGLVGTACAKGGGGGDAGDGGTAAGTITLEMKDFTFQPQVLEGEAGQTVTVAIHNEDDVAHTFTVASQGIDMEVQPGASAEAEVTFDAQAVPFVCRFHEAGGMTGEMVVAGAAGGASPPAGMDDTGGGGFDPYG